MDDERLLSEMGEVAQSLINRHTLTAREWFPHEYIPWERGQRISRDSSLDGGEFPLSEAARTAMVVVLLTEDKLPHYFAGLSQSVRWQRPFIDWVQLWTAEEGRHSIAMRDYLCVNRAVDLVELERARMRIIAAGKPPQPPSIAEGLVYLTMQELATRIVHRNTAKLLPDQEGYAILARIAVDENLHFLFYRDAVKAALEVDPSGMMQCIDRQLQGFSMPGSDIEHYARHVSIMLEAGVYDFETHYSQILVPVLLHAWKIDTLTDLTPAGEVAQASVLARLDRFRKAAEREKARRERRARLVAVATTAD